MYLQNVISTKRGNARETALFVLNIKNNIFEITDLQYLIMKACIIRRQGRLRRRHIIPSVHSVGRFDLSQALSI